MSASLEHVNALLGHYSHLVSAIESISTLLAVIVSLTFAVAAKRANNTRLKAWVEIERVHHSTIDPTNRPVYLTAMVRNIGIMPLRLPFAFFSWKLPVLKNAIWTANPLDAYSGDRWIPQKTYPVEILPRTTQRLFISDMATFSREFPFLDIVQRYGFLGRILCPSIKAIIYTDDGSRCKAKIGNSVRREMRRLRR